MDIFFEGIIQRVLSSELTFYIGIYTNQHYEILFITHLINYARGVTYFDRNKLHIFFNK